MFTHDNLRTLRNARPFVPFRLVQSDGGAVDVRSPEVVLVGRHFAVVGLLDLDATDTLIDRWVTIWYMHVTRAEQLSPGQPPFTAPPPGPAESPTPSPR
jgi:hypothetical protein